MRSSLFKRRPVVFSRPAQKLSVLLTKTPSGPATVSTVGNASATEGTSIVHTVNLSGTTLGSESFAASCADVTATGGVDYTSNLASATYSAGVTYSAGNLLMPVGITSFTVTIATASDTIDEGASETYTLTIGGVSGTGTITDDDNAPTVSTVSSNSATEGSPIVHTVALSNTSSSSVVFAITLSGGTATGGGTDYTSTLTNGMFSDGVTVSGGNITVPAGVSGFTVTVQTSSDTIDEGASETYTLTIGGVSGTGTITDDDSAPVITVGNASPVAPGASAVFTVTLSNASSSVVTATCALADGTAVAGVDYTNSLTSANFSNGVTYSAGTISIPAGVTSFTVTVPTI